MNASISARRCPASHDQCERTSEKAVAYIGNGWRKGACEGSSREGRPSNRGAMAKAAARRVEERERRLICSITISAKAGFCEPNRSCRLAFAPKTDLSGGKSKLMACVSDSQGSTVLLNLRNDSDQNGAHILNNQFETIFQKVLLGLGVQAVSTTRRS